MWLYKGHIGGFYVLSQKRPDRELVCPICGGVDKLIGFAATWRDVVRMTREYAALFKDQIGYALDYLVEIAQAVDRTVRPEDVRQYFHELVKYEEEAC